MNPLLVWLLVSSLVSFGIVWAAVQKREAPKSRYFILLSLFLAAYVFGRFLEAAAPTLAASYVGVLVQYLGMPYIPIASFLFLMDYYNLKVKNWVRILLFVPPLITTVLVATSEHQDFYYRAIRFFPGPPIAQVMIEPGPYYYFQSVYYYLLLAICLGLTLWGAKRYGKAERKQSLGFFAAMLLPVLAGLSYAFGLSPLGLDFTPMMLCISSIFLWYAVYRLNLLKILPLAKDAMLEKMRDAFVIIDGKNNYVESNIAAKRLFPYLADMRVGQEMNESHMPKFVMGEADGERVVVVQQEGGRRYYHMSETDVFQNGKRMCTCFIFYDITQTRSLMEELKSMATYDSLTGIYNRASFYELAGYAFDTAVAQNTRAAALAIDIDHFKRINDTYGHFGGDEVIRTVAKALEGRLRHGDVLGRVGGEEFSIFLPNANLENAVRIAQSLRELIEMESFFYEDRQIQVTISIGVAVLDTGGHDKLEQLLLDADKALYQAKDMGRNKVCTHEG